MPEFPAYSTASMFIWTDKYAYQPGEAITLRWTARANGDTTTPYTAVIYLQNNTDRGQDLHQRDQPALLPMQSISSEGLPTRVSRRYFLATHKGRASLDRRISPAATVGAVNELGMHTFVLEVRDSTGARIVKPLTSKSVS